MLLSAYSTYSSALKKKLRSSRTLVNAYQTTRRHDPEDSPLHVTATRITCLTSTLIGTSIKTCPNVRDVQFSWLSKFGLCSFGLRHHVIYETTHCHNLEDNPNLLNCELTSCRICNLRLCIWSGLSEIRVILESINLQTNNVFPPCHLDDCEESVLNVKFLQYYVLGIYYTLFRNHYLF
jgi:hypothetical protein